MLIAEQFVKRSEFFERASSEHCGGNRFYRQTRRCFHVKRRTSVEALAQMVKEHAVWDAGKITPIFDGGVFDNRKGDPQAGSGFDNLIGGAALSVGTDDDEPQGSQFGM